MLKNGIIPTILFIMVMIGCIIVNIKNTEALSPFGNTIDNYQIVTKEFGEDFSEFIKDKANIKIYLNKEEDTAQVQIGKNEIKFTKNNIFITKIKSIGNFFIKQISKIENTLEKITENKTKLYRAPYGEYNDTVIKTAQENGYYTIQWNLDTLDYKGLTGEEMWNRLKGKIDKGSIILSHNGTKHTADSLDKLIKNIKQKGLEVVRVSDLIYEGDYTINNNGTQVKSK